MEPATVENCPACGSRSTRSVYRRRYQEKEWALVLCGACRLHFTSPTPSDADIQRFYAGDYHAELRTEGGAEARFGAKYRRYADTLARHVRAGRVVDVGCSTGLLVRMLRDRGYDAEGLELNPRSAAWGSEHYAVPIRTEPLDRCAYAPRSLDAVLLTDVLEHTPHPGRFLRGVGELLVPGGHVLVTFPDINSVESRYQRVLARVLRREWLWSSCHIPLHTWEFTRATAEACFIEAGFHVVEFRRSHPPGAGQMSSALRVLGAPCRPLAIPPIGRLLGSQMEFVIQKRAEASEKKGTGRRRAKAAGPVERSERLAAPNLRPSGVGAERGS